MPFGGPPYGTRQSHRMNALATLGPLGIDRGAGSPGVNSRSPRPRSSPARPTPATARGKSYELSAAGRSGSERSAKLAAGDRALPRAEMVTIGQRDAPQTAE